ncbi:hypothetical protein [Mesobacterium pallidum]|uniref:hypothetical protein n=1 Tax=Mesobacterium pallidum TaxID=2872037 RepID=UPI001EE2D662|nr:hypothetical protein [Mesobacterium pallidum]
MLTRTEFLIVGGMKEARFMSLKRRGHLRLWEDYKQGLPETVEAATAKSRKYAWQDALYLRLVDDLMMNGGLSSENAGFAAGNVLLSTFDRIADPTVEIWGAQAAFDSEIGGYWHLSGTLREIADQLEPGMDDDALGEPVKLARVVMVNISNAAREVEREAQKLGMTVTWTA